MRVSSWTDRFWVVVVVVIVGLDCDAGEGFFFFFFFLLILMFGFHFNRIGSKFRLRYILFIYLSFPFLKKQIDKNVYE